jgi:hypothetical protein
MLGSKRDDEIEQVLKEPFRHLRDLAKEALQWRDERDAALNAVEKLGELLVEAKAGNAARLKAAEEAGAAVVRDYPVAAFGTLPEGYTDGYGSIRRLAEVLGITRRAALTARLEAAEAREPDRGRAVAELLRLRNGFPKGREPSAVEIVDCILRAALIPPATETKE